MKSASIFNLAVVVVSVFQIQGISSSDVRGLRRNYGYHGRLEINRMLKWAGARFSSSHDEYSYGGEFYGSFHKEGDTVRNEPKGVEEHEEFVDDEKSKGTDMKGKEEGRSEGKKEGKSKGKQVGRLKGKQESSKAQKGAESSKKSTKSNKTTEKGKSMKKSKKSKKSNNQNHPPSSKAPLSSPDKMSKRASYAPLAKSKASPYPLYYKTAAPTTSYSYTESPIQASVVPSLAPVVVTTESPTAVAAEPTVAPASPNPTVTASAATEPPVIITPSPSAFVSPPQVSPTLAPVAPPSTVVPATSPPSSVITPSPTTPALKTLAPTTSPPSVTPSASTILPTTVSTATPTLTPSAAPSTVVPATPPPSGVITPSPTPALKTLAPTATPPSVTPSASTIPPTTASTAPSAMPLTTTIAPFAPSSSPSFSIAQRVAPYSLQGGQEFNDPESYQSQSLSFVESIPGVSGLSDAKVVQYYALGCIFFATFAVPNPATDPHFGKGVKPPGWNSTSNWLNVTIDPCGMPNATKPAWKGITCDGDRVTRVDLKMNGLTGTFPAEITILSADNPSQSGNLNYVDLSLNGYLFAYNLDNWIGMLGSNLQFLYFEGTSFYSTNGVPEAISNLTNLQELDCSYSLLTGPLRDAPFRGLNNIVFLVLSGNAYNSTIPTVFRSLPSLQYLYLQNAFLSGDLSFAQDLQSIRELWVDQNPGISGPVFPFFGSLQNLQSLSLTDNQLTGELPSEISNLSNVLQMWFYNNKLEGTFPQEWSSLSRLEKLEFEANAITGNLTDFCSILGPPFGALKDLGADCQNLTACPCCTCCSLQQCNAVF